MGAGKPVCAGRFNLTTNTGVLKFMRIHTPCGGANEGYHDILIANPGATFWNASTKLYFLLYLQLRRFAEPDGIGVGRPTT